MTPPSDAALSVRPVVSYPRRATAGTEYLFTIDLDWEAAGGWPYPDEEYPVYCMVDPRPHFDVRPLGEPEVVLHRFGGSYGPARFVLTARRATSQARIRVQLVNSRGRPVRALHLGNIRIDDPRPPARCPFVGLRPYREDEADVFFGRERECRDLVRQMESKPILIVTGDRWAGKTSLLSAGVVPHVRRHGLAGVTGWVVATVRPGDPALVDRGEAVRGILYPAGVFRAPRDKPLLLIVDPFEDLLTHWRNGSEVRRFVNEIGRASLESETHPMRLVFVVQTGFAEGLLREVGLYGSTWPLAPVAPNPSQSVRLLRRAAEAGFKLSSRSGWATRYGVLSHVVTAAAGQVSASGAPPHYALPLAQARLVEMWAGAAARGTAQMTHADYDAAGGLGDTLARLAEAAYQTLPADLQDAAERVLVKLALESRHARPGQQVAVFPVPSPDPEPAEAVVTHFESAGLIEFTPGGPDERPEPVLVFAGLLLDHWDRLKRWVAAAEFEPVDAAPTFGSTAQLTIYDRSGEGDPHYLVEYRESVTARPSQWVVPLGGSHRTLVADIPTSLRGMWNRSGRDERGFLDRLERFGEDLAKNLLPAQLIRLIADRRHDTDRRLLLVGPAEVPWEILYVRRSAGSGAGVFLGDLGLVRWLPDQPAPPTTLTVRPGGVRAIVSHEIASAGEPESVQELFDTHGLGVRFLEPGQIYRLSTKEVVYLGAQSTEVESDGVRQSAIRFELGPYDGALQRTEWSAVEVGVAVAKVVRGGGPLVVLNTCRRADGRAVMHADFATTLLTAGVGIFAGNLWSVTEERDIGFPREFLAALFSGQTLAEAAHYARQNPSPLRLTYSVFGHPDARLVIDRPDEPPHPRPGPAPERRPTKK